MIRLVGARYVIVYVEFLSFFHMFIFLCAVILQLYVVGSCPFDLDEKICMYVFLSLVLAENFLKPSPKCLLVCVSSGTCGKIQNWGFFGQKVSKNGHFLGF